MQLIHDAAALCHHGRAVRGRVAQHAAVSERELCAGQNLDRAAVDRRIVGEGDVVHRDGR